MHPDKEIEQRHVVITDSGQRQEVLTERVAEREREFRLSPGTIALLVILALVAVGIAIYVVNNKNKNEEANRQALLEASQGRQQSPQQPTIVQPPVQQPPVIIQQPAPAQQAPIVVQQPAPTAQERNSPLADITIQDAATKRLTDEADLSPVTVTVVAGKAILMGTVDSAEIKARAERVVKAVQGVKSVDNQIVVSSQ